MNPLAERLQQAIVPTLAYYYIRLLHGTMSWEQRQLATMEQVRRDAGNYIMTFWHSRFVMMPYVYPHERVAVLLSRHRDARMLGAVMRRFGVEVAWGSSTAGGVAGLRSVLRRIKAGSDVGLAPDGPRGPRRRAKPGVIAIARLGGMPIIPVAFSASRARRLRSWDHTLVPKLFSRGLAVCGSPLEVPRDADEAEQERLRQVLERELDRLTDEADREMGLGLEEPRPPVEEPAAPQSRPAAGGR